MMDKYKYFFGCLQYTGKAAMKKLLKIYGNEEMIFHVSDSELKREGVLTDNQYKELVEKRKNTDIDMAYLDALKAGIRCTCMTESSYPGRLRDISGAPYMLFYYGELPDEDIGSAAIIGARMCSDYGRKSAEYFAEGLASRGVQIISGLAAGIDGIAQQKALDVGGRSFGILGSGVDICYPASNRMLYNKLKKEGGVISEYPLGTKPVAKNFPMRNRIISGLADIVLVIEAKPRSGTSITVSMALEQGRQVYAVPGRISDALSQGCNKLIYEGAGAATDIEVVLEELDRIKTVRNVERASNAAVEELAPRISDVVFEDEMEQSIYNLICKGTDDIEHIMNALGDDVSAQEVASKLMYMVMRGIVEENVGRYTV